MNQEFPNFSVLLSSTPRGARLARLLTTEQLRVWGLPLHPAEHIVAELAANAITHGHVPGRDFRLTLYVVGNTLRIEVSDTRRERLPQLQQPTPGAESGRGLLLVDALADRWGVREERFPRKTVWAELRCSEPEPASTGFGAAGDPHSKNRGRKNPTKPHPSRPPHMLTRTGEHHRFGWIGRPPTPLRSAQPTAHMRRPPAGSHDPDRGPDHRGRHTTS